MLEEIGKIILNNGLRKKKKSNSNEKQCVGVVLCTQFFIFFILSQFVAVLFMPAAVLFLNGNGEGPLSINLLSEQGLQLQKQLGCNYSHTIAVAKEFYKCSDLAIDNINVVVGGLIEHFGSNETASAMAFGNTVFVSSRPRYWTKDGCLDVDTMVHECNIKHQLCFF